MSEDPMTRPVSADRPLTRRERRELERRELESRELESRGQAEAEVRAAATDAVEPQEAPAASRGASRRASRSASRRDEPPAITGAQRVVSAAFVRPRRLRRRTAVLLALVLVVVMVGVPLAVARLRGTEEQAPSTAAVLAADTPIDQAMHVAGRVGATPVVSLTAALSPVNDLVKDVVVAGEGRTVSQGEPVLLSVSTFSGTDGTNTTGTETGTRLYLGTLDAGALGEVLADAIKGVTEGSRVVLRAPVKDDKGSRYTEITVVDILPTTATGTEVAPAEGVPAVTVADDGTVTASVEGLTVPNVSRSATLIRGDGEQVTDTSRVVVRTALLSWSTGQLISSTWGTDVVPGVIDMEDTLSGIAQYLVDARVGSRVVLALTADQARGDEAVVVVIDVLAIDHGTGTDPSAAPSQTPVPVVPLTSPPTAGGGAS